MTALVTQFPETFTEFRRARGREFTIDQLAEKLEAVVTPVGDCGGMTRPRMRRAPGGGAAGRSRQCQ